MAGASALFSDGLDLLAEFLACSRPTADGIAASYEQAVQWRAAAAELARWSEGDAADAGGLLLDEANLRIIAPEPLWNRLYARALVLGRTVAPDRIGLSTRGAGGMLGALSAIPAMAQALRLVAAPAALADAGGEPWQMLPWQQLRTLMLRDCLLTREAMRPRPLLEVLPACADRLDASVRQHGFLLQQPGLPTQLVCTRAWHERTVDKLGRHFTEGVLLLFRLMFFSTDQGWGWDADSGQCDGLVALMDDAQASGLARFDAFRDSCAALAGAVREVRSDHRPPSWSALLAAAVRELVALWPADSLEAAHPSRHLMAGWMTQVHPGALVAPEAWLGPGVVVGHGCIIKAGAVLHGCAEIAPGLVVPAGVVVAAGARVARLSLGGVTLPPGTLLRGSVVIRSGASIGRQVWLGANVEIGFGVEIPDGVHVADEASVYALRLGAGVRLPAGTVIAGSLSIEAGVHLGDAVRMGNNVLILSGAFIGDGVRLPDNVVVAAGARVRRCALARGAFLGPGAVLHGDLALGAGARVGTGAILGAGAEISPGVVLPPAVTVQAGARIDRLRLNACTLPPGTVLGGDLILGKGCRIGCNVVFGGGNRIGRNIDVPGGLRIARGARIARMQVAGAMLPPGTVIEGEVFVAPGTRIGRGVTLQAGASVSAPALPDGVIITQGAVVHRCDVAGARLGCGVRIGGDLYLACGVHVGRNVRFHRDVTINTPCRIPDGIEFLPEAVVNWFLVAPDVVLPPGTRVGGNLCLRRGVTVGAGVTFGAGAVVERNVAIPNGARIGHCASVNLLRIAPEASLPHCYTLHGNAVICAGACIGAKAVLGKNVEIGAGVRVPPGVVLLAGARVSSLRIADEVAVPAGTRIGGNLVLRRGVRIGRDVELSAGADIGPHVALPDGVVVCPDAKVRTLCIARDALLPPGVCIGGNLTLGAGVRIGPGVRFGAGVRLEGDSTIGSGVRLPDGVLVGRDTWLDVLDIASDVNLPPGTCINGDLSIASGVQVGRHVCFGAHVHIGPGVRIPDNTVLMDGASIDSLQVGAGAVFNEGLNLRGNAVIGEGACIEDDVVLGCNVVIGPGVRLPMGTSVADNACVLALHLGADVHLPAEFSIAGDLWLDDEVVVGEGAGFGTDVVVGAGVIIGSGAVIGENTVICAGAVLGERAWVAPDGVVDAGMHIPAGGLVMTFMPGALPSADADFHLWQQFLSHHAVTAVEQESAPASHEPMPPTSAPVAIPQPRVLQPLLRGYPQLPGPFT